MDITPEAKKRLALLIEERDFPLTPLAAKIGVSQSTLWNFVYGETKNFSKIHRLATELKVSLDWILNGTPSEKTEGSGIPKRVAENAGIFAYNIPAADKNLIRDIGSIMASLARRYSGLADDVFGAIAVALWCDVKAGKIAVPQARGKSSFKIIAAEAQRLVIYELNKAR